MSAKGYAERLAALLNEIEQAGYDVHTLGSSVVVGDVKIVMGTLVGDPWTVEVPEPVDPRFRVTVDSPERYFRSGTGVLHLRAVVVGGSLSNSHSRCGLTFSLGRQAIPLKVSEGARVCHRCHRSEP